MKMVKKKTRKKRGPSIKFSLNYDKIFGTKKPKKKEKRV